MDIEEQNKIMVWQSLSTALSEINKNNLVEAIKILLNCIDDDPDCSPAYNHLGWIYNMMEDYEKAENYYQKSIKCPQVFSSVYVNYSILLNSLNRSDDLEKIYFEAITIDNVRKDILHCEYGIMLEKKGKYSDAITVFKESIKHSLISQDVEFYNNAIKRCELKMKSTLT